MLQVLRRVPVVFFAVSLLSVGFTAHAQDSGAPHRGRKYKAPLATSHIEVTVIKNATGKPVVNAAVIFRATRNGKDDGNLEVKTDPDGKAVIDVITTGSKVQVQVFATGFATFADSYQVDEPSREIHVALMRPREQVSAYEDNSGKASTRKAGVQEPQPQKAPPSATTLQTRPGTTGGSSSSGSSNGGTPSGSSPSGNSQSGAAPSGGSTSAPPASSTPPASATPPASSTPPPAAKPQQ